MSNDLRDKLMASTRWTSAVDACDLEKIVKHGPFDIDALTPTQKIAVELWATGTVDDVPECVAEYLARVS